MAVEALFWFHPVVWWLGARLMEERERACDEEVLLTGAEPEAYAEGILRVREMRLEAPPPCAAGVTGANLRKRIEEIMGNRIGRPPSRRKAPERLRRSLRWCPLNDAAPSRGQGEAGKILLREG
jgi:beta-lactamase regulating signal transducer with metallopeptidase domain